MGTRNASMRTEFNGEKPVFVQDPDVINVQQILGQRNVRRESALTAAGAIFARGSVASPFGFTLVRDYEGFGAIAPAGDGKHPGPRDMAALLYPLSDGQLQVWAPFIGSEDAFQECLGSVNLSNTVRSGVTKVANADYGYAFVEQPGRNEASIAIYKLAGTLTKAQAQQAYQQGLFQKEVAVKLRLDVLTQSEREAERQTQEDAAARQSEERQRQFQDQERLIQEEIENLKAQAKLRELQAERDRLLAGGTGTGTGTTPGTFRTYEIYGTLNGVKVPLAQVVVNQGGRYVMVPGGVLFVGDNPADGFGLAGIPGRWSTYYGGQSPTQFGLDADRAVMGWDGARGWAVPASTLMQMFGADWRMKIY